MNTSFTPLIAVFGLIAMAAFPKAGFYYGNVPITFGYLILGVFGIFEIIQKAVQQKQTFPPVFAFLGLGIFGFGVIQIAALRIYGFKSVGVAVSILVSTLVVPALAILSTQWMIRAIGVRGIIRSLRWSLFIVFTFGMVSFLAYNLKGLVIGVPYLTTTGNDLSQIFARHNLRGGIVKMFSTYNNGNILGINLLIWGPLAAVGLKGSMRAAIGYRSVCLLTLSRSVWAGLMAYEVVGAFLEKSTVRIQRALIVTTVLSIAAVCVSVSIGKDPAEFLLDKNLGGRVSDLQGELRVISQQRIGWDSESVYAAAWLAYGPIGVIAIVVIWSIPIIFANPGRLQQTARLSLLVYMLVASVEGAFHLIPTQAMYWMVATIAMTDFATLGQTSDGELRETRMRESVVLPELPSRNLSRRYDQPIAPINSTSDPIT